MGKEKSMKIALLHPDLGIGGAERLMVDIALALQKQGHTVDIFTSHHDDHSFEETRDGTLNVIVHGDFLPRHIFNRFFILCSTIRALFLSFVFSVFYGSYDVVVCDTNSAYMPLIKLLTKSKIFFYCHMPDQVLCIRTSLIKKLYRIPFDLLEEFFMCFADEVCVNSNYTQGRYYECFCHLSMIPKASVLYPCVDIKEKPHSEVPEEVQRVMKGSKGYFVSVNRYERKKAVERCIEALNKLRDQMGEEQFESENIRLVILGGYDTRVNENVEYYEELRSLAINYHLDDHVFMYKSPSAELRDQFVSNSVALIYTPTDEHFGIVPLEAMMLQRPVIAHNSGGPKETVVPKLNGFLFETIEDIANDMNILLNDSELAKKYGQQGKERIIEKFSFASFSQQLNDLILSMKYTANKPLLSLLTLAFFVGAVLAIYFLFSLI